MWRWRKRRNGATLLELVCVGVRRASGAKYAIVCGVGEGGGAAPEIVHSVSAWEFALANGPTSPLFAALAKAAERRRRNNLFNLYRTYSERGSALVNKNRRI